jgi:hypothetical protein
VYEELYPVILPPSYAAFPQLKDLAQATGAKLLVIKFRNFLHLRRHSGSISLPLASIGQDHPDVP